MSRVAKNPIQLPRDVKVAIAGQQVTVTGARGSLAWAAHGSVEVAQEDGALKVRARENSTRARALAGTARALLNNMVTGVSAGFQRKLDITGVGFRAQVQGRKLNLTLGYSHPVEVAIPEGITVETPSQTEIVVRGADRRLVGQFAANIRAYRKPEPYKGKGIKYSDEQIVRKEAKKG